MRLQKTASGLLFFGMILLVLALLPSTLGVLMARQWELQLNPLPFRSATVWMLLSAIVMIVVGFTIAVVDGVRPRRRPQRFK